MKNWLIMATSEVRQLLRIRSVQLMLFGLPLLLIFLLGNALDSDIKPVKLSAYIAEGEALGPAVEAYLQSDAVVAAAEVGLTDSEAQVREDLLAGKADYGFALKAGFSEAYLGGGGQLRYYQGAMGDRNLAAEAVLDGLLQALRLNQAVAAALPSEPGRDQGEETGSPLTAPGQFAAMPEDGATAVVRVGTLIADGSVQYGDVSAIQYYAVAYLIMFLLFSGMSAAISLTEERDKGTLLRLYAMPVPVNALLFGKLSGVLLFSFLQSSVIVGFTRIVYGVEWGGNYAAIGLICMLVSLSAICFAVIVTSLLRTVRAIESVFMLLITAMTFLSGGMIPDLDRSLRQAGDFTINHWANEALRGLMAGSGFSGIGGELAVLGGIAAVLLLLSAIRFRKAVAL